MANLTCCPHCNADLAETLPDGRTGSRVIGVEIWGVYDGVLFWRCPDCGGSWHRWSVATNLRLYEKAAKYVGTQAKTDAALKAWAKSMGLEVSSD